VTGFGPCPDTFCDEPNCCAIVMWINAEDRGHPISTKHISMKHSPKSLFEIPPLVFLAEQAS